MNRTERLTHILEFLKKGMSLTIDGISTEFGISERTVFRDLKTLKKLGYKVDFDNGYRLTDSTRKYLLAELSELQLELISFALKTHHLRYFLPLNELSAKISDGIGDSSQNGFFKELNQTSFHFNKNLSSKIIEEKVKLTTFINAAEQNKCVIVRTKSGQYDRKYRPAGIILGSTGVQLLVQDDSDAGQVKVSLNDIQRIEIAAKSDFPAAISK